MRDPARHFAVNVAGGLSLVRAAVRHKVQRFIFSSTAATYGNTSDALISEGHPQSPINAYGESKLLFERILEWFRRAYGLNYVAFRYFNAAGAVSEVGEVHHPETHLIPNVLSAALDSSKSVTLFGDDYPTVDGTCVRDYIHVDDLAQAHVDALEYEANEELPVFNLGVGRGYSVSEVIETARQVTGRDISVKVAERRAGDPPVLVADPGRARTILRWQPQYDSLQDIVGTAWEWLVAHPNGY
jgi:UDP-glucose 4-epimerase